MESTKKSRSKSDAELLDHATDSLLAALKKEMIANEGGIDHEKLRKDGYSPRLLGRLDEAKAD